MHDELPEDKCPYCKLKELKNKDLIKKIEDMEHILKQVEMLIKGVK